jgi:hypothetical protein
MVLDTKFLYESELDIPVGRGLDNICQKNNVGVTNQSSCPDISPLSYLKKKNPRKIEKYIVHH